MPETVAASLRDRAAAIAPDAEFRAEHVAEFGGAYTITRRLLQVARELEPSVVFLGSENAGQIVTPVSSVASHVASDTRYDVFLVRHPAPVEADAPAESGPEPGDEGA